MMWGEWESIKRMELRLTYVLPFFKGLLQSRWIFLPVRHIVCSSVKSVASNHLVVPGIQSLKTISVFVLCKGCVSVCTAWCSMKGVCIHCGKLGHTLMLACRCVLVCVLCSHPQVAGCTAVPQALQQVHLAAGSGRLIWWWAKACGS